MSRSTTLYIVLIIAAVALWAMTREVRHDTVVGTVTYVRGGDTLRVEDITIRLSGVASPAIGEPYRAEAEAYLTDLVFGKTVQCDVTSLRSYDRRFGMCYLDGTDIGLSVISAGLARDCPRHSNGLYEAFNTSASVQLPLPEFCEPR